MSEGPRDVCPSILLEDSPAERDEFSGAGRLGPHSRLAKSVAELISSSSEGRLISIEGSWGSGKSTVVRLISAELASNPSNLVFEFDAWAHSGDPLRLEFLQALSSRLSPWIDVDRSKPWFASLAALSQRVKETTTHTKPVPTPFGVLFALSLLVVPIGAALLQKGLRDGYVMHGTEVAWELVIGFFLCVLPIVGSLFYWLLKPRDLSRLAVIGGQKEVVLQTSESATVEPTTIQFESLFRDLLGLALEGQSDRHLLIVIDNLDRVPAPDLVAIWTTLQTFTRVRSSPGSNAVARHWVLVPFDPKEVFRLWSLSEGAADRVALRTSSELLDKTFHARFELPPPVASDWRSYLKSSLVKALPEHEKDSDLVCRVFNIAREGRSTSPREIKSFINQVAAIHRQWPNHEFELGEIAFYVLLRRSDVDVASMLLKGEAIDSRIKLILGERLEEGLAALAFNIERGIGFQTLLAGPAYDALAKGDAESFDTLVRTHEKTIWPVVSSLMVKVAQASEPEFSAVLSTLLGSSAASDFRAEFGSLFQLVFERASKIAAWEPASEQLGAALGRIAIDSKEDKRLAISSAVGASISPPSLAANMTEPDGEIAGLKMAIAFGDELARAGLPIPRFKHGRVVNRWLANLETLEEMGSRVSERFFGALSPTEVIKGLVPYLEPNKSGVIVKALRHLKLDETVVANDMLLRSWEIVASGPEAPLAGDVINALTLLSASKVTDQTSDSDRRNRALVSLWGSLPGSPRGPEGTRAFLVTLASAFDELKANAAGLHPRIQNRIPPYLSANDEETVSSLVAGLKEFDLVDRYFEFAASRESLDPLTGAVISELYQDPALQLRIPFHMVLKMWSDGIRESFKSGDPKGLAAYIRGTSIDKIVASIEGDSFRLHAMDLYAALISNTEHKRVFEIISPRVSQASVDTWRSVFEDPGLSKKAFALFRAIGERVPEGQALPFPAVDAMINLFEQGKVPTADVFAKLVAWFVEAQSVAQRADSSRRIAHQLIHNDSLNLSRVLTFEPWRELADAVLENQDGGELLRNVLTSNDSTMLRWLIRLFEVASDRQLSRNKSQRSQVKTVFLPRLSSFLNQDDADSEFKREAEKLREFLEKRYKRAK